MTHNSSAWDYTLRPPDGVSFALPEQGLDQEFRLAVLEQMSRLEWHRYQTLPPAARDALPWGGSKLVETIYTRGAEEAIYQVTTQLRAERILCARWSYPGYARIARRVGVELVCFESLADLDQDHKLRESDVVIVTDPGNPLDDPSALKFTERRHRARVIVDGAYLNPFEERFLDLAVQRARRGIPTVFTLSKCVGLAGVRLAGILTPKGYANGILTQDTRFWDLLTVSILSVLSTEFGRMKVGESVRAGVILRDAIMAVLTRIEIQATLPRSSLFITVTSRTAGRQMIERLASLLKGKSFFAGHDSAYRIDVCIENLKEIDKLGSLHPL